MDSSSWEGLIVSQIVFFFRVVRRVLAGKGGISSLIGVGLRNDSLEMGMVKWNLLPRFLPSDSA
ncbi:MAG: hypothetical protein ACKO2V_08535, partial [Snowella sp.]